MSKQVYHVKLQDMGLEPGLFHTWQNEFTACVIDRGNDGCEEL